MADDPSMSEMLKQDPKFKFFETQVKNGEMPQSLLDGILNKTLVIQNKKLTAGTTSALAESVANFNDFVSKIVLENNGILDQDFAGLLESINELKSFRSISIKKNELGHQSVHYLEKILQKRVPNHLEELRIEGCPMP